VKVVSVAQMRALEAASFASGTSEAELQERAGTAVAEEVFRLLSPGDRVVVLVGHGNNGRDGAVAALWLQRHGPPTSGVDLVLAPRHALTSDELAALRAGGATLIGASDEPAIRGALSSARVVVDALLGIGATGALREPMAMLARSANESSAQVVALDIPSGIDADSGEVAGEAVRADVTVTLGGVKQGLLRFPAAEYVGRLVARSIGLDDSALPYTTIDREMLSALVPRRPLDAHKYRFGRALIVAGTDHFLGAPVLCASAAARIGAGLVTVGSTRDVRLTVGAQLPEATFTTEDVHHDARPLAAYLANHNAMVIGPGLGRGAVVTRMVETVLRTRPREHFVVIDADALVALAEIPNWQTLVDSHVILTPHAGELARLTGDTRSDEPLWAHASRLAQQWGCVLLAKGPFTSVASPEGQVAVWPHANPALATGGTGDVLAGICGGLLAQGLTAWDAARFGVGVHALAAETVLARNGWRTLLASDLPDKLPGVLAELSQVTPRR
jgi:hydroxyethylthiazole kinase-like uncharacterized protein yjeF